MPETNSSLLKMNLQQTSSAQESELFAQLQKVTAGSAEANKILALFRILAVEFLKGMGAAHLRKAANQKWQTDRASMNGQVTAEEIVRPALQTWFDQAIAQNQDLRVWPDGKDPFQYLIIPTADQDETKSILLVKCSARIDSENLRASLNMLRMIATFHELWFSKQASEHQRKLFQATAAVIELVSEIEACDNIQHACHKITHQTKRYLNCLAVSAGVMQGNRFETVANSEVASFDRDSDIYTAYQHAWQEASIRDSMSVWPPLPGEARHGLIQHRKLVERLRVQAAISSPLKTEDGELIGVLTVVGDTQDLRSELSINFLECAGSRVASALEVLRRAQQGPLRRVYVSLGKKTRKRKLLIASAVTALLGAVMLVPVPYRIRCQCTSEAVFRRFVAAPFDGVIQSGHVRAGDIVKRSELLAEMNGREIRQELAGAVFEKHRADKQRDLYLAKADVAQSLLADLESKRLQATTDLLEHRQANLNILSPIDGVVLNGDLDQAEDMPVQVGQTLFEIGPLDPIKIELAIPADEISNVRRDMPVKIWLSGLGSRPIGGKIGNIFPDAEVQENANVYIAEVILQNQSHLLRPGMSGKASITADAHSLGWNLFHKPWEFVVSRLSW